MITLWFYSVSLVSVTSEKFYVPYLSSMDKVFDFNWMINFLSSQWKFVVGNH